MQLEPQRGMIPLTLDRPRILFFELVATWLLVEKYGVHFPSELYTVKTLPRGADGKPHTQIAPKDPEALAYFLWAGLQAEAKDLGEPLTLQEVTAMIRPWNFAKIFNSVIIALSGATSTPELPGKKPAAAATAKSAAERSAPAKASTSPRRKGSPSVH